MANSLSTSSQAERTGCPAGLRDPALYRGLPKVQTWADLRNVDDPDLTRSERENVLALHNTGYDRGQIAEVLDLTFDEVEKTVQDKGDNPPPPQRPKLTVSWADVEAAVQLLRRAPQGVTVCDVVKALWPDGEFTTDDIREGLVRHSRQWAADHAAPGTAGQQGSRTT